MKEDCGVNYTRDKRIAREQGWEEFHYTRQHTLNGQITNRVVYCKNRDDFNRLLKFWRFLDDTWQYEEII